MTYGQIIVLATPVFLAMIALEYFVGRARGRNTYRLHDAVSSIGLGMLSQMAGIAMWMLNIGIYIVLYREARLFDLDASQPWVWLLALLLYDFCFYWHHRAGHRVALLWASHVVHHSSEEYNLSTALRQPATAWLAGWIFYLPIALLGVPPVVFSAVALIDVLYQYWIHTQQVGRLGWFDRVFSSPSNHRVHHAVNERYVDRNYGGVLILWDRLFGTFQEERDDDRPVYGTRTPLRSFDPIRANFEVYAVLARDSWHARAWRDKLRVWIEPPEWRPADVAARFPKPAFDLVRVEYFDPPMTRAGRMTAVGLFGVALGTSASWLWHGRASSPAVSAAAALLVLACLVLMGRVCQRGLRPAPSA